ncbi:response regulator transcription factor [Ramlibacter sp. USB13]|uniref:Response regulator transcription factor n=1 Tax=Ramlibacter cellulosilyticus TaxID=2764187 RepID=A0A923MU61_9BURK|nr:response regulator [Ramlibacter cellulosilyticus]MBC5783832.1 response regulator transcription factor [Ramlibacter cellulosilyticus]
MTGTIHIIDDDTAVRGALQRVLAAAGYATKCYAAAGDYLLPPPDPSPGCLLLDVQLPGFSGLDLQDALPRHPGYEHPIVFLSGADDIRASVQAMRAGAREFLTKPVDQDVLVAAVADAVQHDVRMRALRHETEVARARIAALGQREHLVLEGIASGRLHKQLASDLGVSERTIKADRARIMRTLEVDTLPALLKTLRHAQDAHLSHAH